MTIKVANLKSVQKRLENMKKAEHPTDEKLKQEGKDQEQKKDEFSEKEREELSTTEGMVEENPPATKDEGGMEAEREKDKVDAGDGYGTDDTQAGGSHPTEKDLKEEGNDKSSAEEFSGLGKRAEEALMSLQKMFKQSNEEESQEEMKSEDVKEPKPDVTPEELEPEDSKTPAKSKKDKKKDDDDDDDELTPEEEKAAGKEAAEKVAIAIANMNKYNKQKKVAAVINHVAEMGYKEATMAAQALMGAMEDPALLEEAAAEVDPALVEEIAAMTEGAPEEVSTGGVVTLMDIAGPAKELMEGKSPETPEEKEIAGFLSAIGVLGGSEEGLEETEEDILGLDDTEEDAEETSEEDSVTEDLEEVAKAAREFIGRYEKAAKNVKSKNNKKSK